MYDQIVEEDVKDIISNVGSSLLEMEGARILITGGSGMIASYIVYALLYINAHIFKKPATIYITVRNNDKKFGVVPNLHYILCDVAKEKPDIADVNYIIHAASKAAPKVYEKHMIDTLNTNIIGLYNVLTMVNSHTKSLLFFSSAEIYGSPSENKPIAEDYIGNVDHLNLRSCYVEGKRVGETICMNYFREKKVPVKIARIFHTFGPGINLQDGRIFNDFMQLGLEKKNIVIRGDAQLERSFLYIKDATIMLLKILLSNKNGEVYNVGNDKNTVTVKKFADVVCDSFNSHYKEKITVVNDKKKDASYFKYAVKSIRPDITKFFNQFYYKPTTDIATSVSRTVDYILANQ